MITLLRASLLSAWCFCLAGCAGMRTAAPPTDATEELRPPKLSAEQGRDAIVIGQSSRAEVQAALGQAIVIPFDSGYEVWAYRWKSAAHGTPAHTELVILFDAAGVVKKVRIRPPAPSDH